MNVLFISNGHGEDTIGGYIIGALRSLRSFPESSITAFPLIGSGDAYRSWGAKVVLPPVVVPHGFYRRGALKVVLRQLIRRAPGIPPPGGTLAVAVGDAFPALVAVRFKVPFIFAGVNKSEHYRHAGHRYLPWERALLKRSLVAFIRDEPTCRKLLAQGVAQARYVGNPMMDLPAAEPPAPEPAGTSPRPAAERTIVLLPGSYGDMALNMADLLQAAAACEIAGCGVKRFVMAAHPSAGPDVARAVDARGFAFAGAGWRRGALRVEFGTNDLRAALSACELVLGLAGTANEQAAGLGKPVIGFPTRGIQYTRSFALEQRDLLGEALAIAPGPIGAAEIAENILTDRERYARMSRAGIERMGRPGGSAAIASEIVRVIEGQRS